MTDLLKSALLALLIMGSVGGFADDSASAQVHASESLPSLAVAKITFETEQLVCLAKNIYHEARGEPFEGKVAVAQVTLNRVANSRFPDDICSVVYQKVRGFCQFTWACKTDQSRMKPAVYEESLRVARMVLEEGYRIQQFSRALYFHNTSIDPGWNRTRVGQVGRHVFYR